jgi:osmotically-inducible protein OsmY
MRKILFTLFCLISVSCLQGCIAAGALAVGGATGVAIAADHRSYHTMKQDNYTAHYIRQQISQNACLASSSHIVVVSYNNVVLLAGETTTPEFRDQVVQIAQGSPNVKRIFNEITIQPPISLYQRSTDSTITTNVKTRMIATTNVCARNFKVVTENKVVYLMGITSRDEAEIAAEVARNSSGVCRVVKLVEYTN